jgi:nucleotide-binding universal stress UspA family protein
MSASPGGLVLLAYDGSQLAGGAIAEAGRLLSPGRAALVVCVWQPFDVGFVIDDAVGLDAKQIPEVKAAAQRTAQAGAALAQAAGFDAQSLEVEASPIWTGIVDLAEERDASVIVLGSHGRSGLAGVLTGSVAGAVASHSHRTVLIAHGER